MTEDIRFYCGIGERQWNHHPTSPGPFACVSPVYGNTIGSRQENRVAVPVSTLVIQDSGAFSDGPGQRLSCEAALERQIIHAEKWGYTEQVTHRASYDLLIDEKWEGGRRYKARWTEDDAAMAVKLTVNAAKYLSRQTGPARILSAQGVSARQYLSCAEQIIPLLVPDDLFGLGGWCITGKLPTVMMPVLRETMQAVIPFLGHEGVKRVHIWGVCYAKALGELLYLCDEHGIELSTDSMGPSIRPARGRWGYASWTDTSYKTPTVEVRGLARAQHVQCTREWLGDFRNREPLCYRPMPAPKRYQQLSWDVIEVAV